MSVVVEKKPKADLTPAKRCSYFDEDCADVRDHYLCWTGGRLTCNGGIEYEIDPADGYCPYLIGQMSR